MTASYLHDSLRDLASAAKAVACGASEARVLFMDEPGEHELIMRRRADDVEIEVVWYESWKSWGLAVGDGERRLLGSTTAAELRDEVLSELQRLFITHGEDGYREKWLEHAFPIDEMRELEEAG